MHIAAFTSGVKAQRLPNIQKGSMAAPKSVRIDGVSTEWGSQAFQAFNNATEVFYTIANDSVNLYLIIKSNKSNITNKIMRGGVTFLINGKGVKKDGQGSSIRFPLVGIDELRTMNRSFRTETIEKGVLTPEHQAKRSDSIMMIANKKYLSSFRIIQVNMLKGISDSTLSIYNEYGVRTAIGIDGQNILTYELVVPLKNLDLMDGKEFSYNIKINPPPSRPRAVPVNIPGVGDNGAIGVFKGGVGNRSNLSGRAAEMIAMTTSTDFWGKYLLEKSK